MASIKEIKQELRYREWSEKIQECQNSGMTVKEWCESSGIKLSTYYSRLPVYSPAAVWTDSGTRGYQEN